MKVVSDVKNGNQEVGAFVQDYTEIQERLDSLMWLISACFFMCTIPIIVYVGVILTGLELTGLAYKLYLSLGLFIAPISVSLLTVVTYKTVRKLQKATPAYRYNTISVLFHSSREKNLLLKTKNLRALQQVTFKNEGEMVDFYNAEIDRWRLVLEILITQFGYADKDRDKILDLDCLLRDYAQERLVQKNLMVGDKVFTLHWKLLCELAREKNQQLESELYTVLQERKKEALVEREEIHKEVNDMIIQLVDIVHSKVMCYHEETAQELKRLMNVNNYRKNFTRVPSKMEEKVGGI